MAFGRIALIGSGEYLPEMSEFESSLLQSGGSDIYVQIPTAAGRESKSRLEYWRELGQSQAERLGAKQRFLPIFEREDAYREDLVEQIYGAGLIYFSGGDPHYLANSLLGTPVGDAIIHNWQNGTSLAGCSAGAMVMADEVSIHWRKNKSSHKGFGILPELKIFPHYDRYFGKIPTPLRKLITHADEDQFSIGIDENTALIWNGAKWQVKGKSSVHILNKVPDLKENIFFAEEHIEFLSPPVI